MTEINEYLIDWHMSFGLEQEDGSLIAPVALAHPLHPIDNKSRNRRRILWVEWCVSFWWLLFPSRSSVLIYIYIYRHSLYELCYRTYIYIQQECHSVLVKLHPMTFCRTDFLGSAQLQGWMPLFVFFGLPIVPCSLINSLILGSSWRLVFVLNNTLMQGIWYSAISHLPGCFCPGPSFRISDSTWCHRTPLCHIKQLNLDILQGSFRLCNWLSLRRLVSWINHLPPACWSTFWKSTFKQQLCCRFDIIDSISSFSIFWHMHLYMSWYIISFFGFIFTS